MIITKSSGSFQSSQEKTTKTEFNYFAHFTNEELGTEAKYAFSKFKTFTRRRFDDLLQIGRELWRIQKLCCEKLRTTPGNRKFNTWLASDEFGGSSYLALPRDHTP